MLVQIKRACLVALVIVATPAALVAQQRTPAPAPAPQSQQQNPQVQAWVTELQQVHGKLEAIQAKAMEDAELQAAQQALGNEVKTAMEKIDPELQQSMERVQTLESEALQAQQSGDQAKLQQLAQEAQQIQVRFVNAQSQALQQPELAAKIQSFQTQLEQKMVAVDPEAEGLIKRFQELEGRLQAQMQQPSQPR